MISTAGVSLLLAVEESQVKPGLLGFAVVMAMALAVAVLLRSLSKHLGRIDVDGSSRADAAGPPPVDPERDHDGNGDR